MKTIKTLISIGAMALLGCSAFASGAMTSFGITNYWATLGNVTSYPTNSAGTNGLNRLTGGNVAIYNQDNCITVGLQGYLTCATAGEMDVVFVTSCANNTPIVSATQNDWQTEGGIKVAFPLPVQTNWVNWQTNIVMNTGAGLPNANFIGVYSITNTLTGADTLTNATLFINKKLIPKPLIGG